MDFSPFRQISAAINEETVGPSLHDRIFDVDRVVSTPPSFQRLWSDLTYLRQQTCRNPPLFDKANVSFLCKERRLCRTYVPTKYISIACVGAGLELCVCTDLSWARCASLCSPTAGNFHCLYYYHYWWQHKLPRWPRSVKKKRIPNLDDNNPLWEF